MYKTFNPGDFRYNIIFLKRVNDKDEYGEPLNEWKLYKTVKASKEPILGKELYAALTTETKVEVKFKMRYISGVTDTMRIKHGKDIYEIISAVDVNTAHKEFVCYCRLVKENAENKF